MTLASLMAADAIIALPVLAGLVALIVYTVRRRKG